MIACPHCKTPLRETTEECPSCQLELDRLTKALGPIPIILGGLSDGAQIFNKSEEKKLRKIVNKHQHDFPQSHLHIVTRSFPQKTELRTLLFWIFNRAGLSQESAKHGQNRDVVLLIEPLRKEAALMVGYGLEPLIPQTDLDQILNKAQPFFTSGHMFSGVEMVHTELTTVMKQVSRNLISSLNLKNVSPNEAITDDF